MDSSELNWVVIQQSNEPATLTLPFSNFLLQEHPSVQRLSFPEDNGTGGGAFHPTEI
jgi:hypothetical protein